MMALLHLVVQLAAGWLAVFGHPAPPPAPVPPVAVTAPQAADVATRGHVSTPPVEIPPSAVPAPVVPPVLAQPGPLAEPSCGDGEQWQGEFGCVAVQLPEESGGRAYG